MIIVPKAAFGYVFFVVDVPAGKNKDAIVNQHGLAAWGNYFFTKGEVELIVRDTGEVLENRRPGWLNIEHPDAHASTAGAVITNYIEDSQWLCMPMKQNNDRLPNLASLVLAPGETTTLSAGTNLYLVRGNLEIHGKTFTGPTQIRIRSENATITSIGDTSYSLKFIV